LRFGLVFVQHQKAQASEYLSVGDSPLALFEVAHLRQDFAFYLTKHVKIKKSEAFQYKPDAQARDAEILGKIRSLALRACICATSKLTLRGGICAEANKKSHQANCLVAKT
jgi:hypothetical protein